MSFSIFANIIHKKEEILVFWYAFLIKIRLKRPKIPKKYNYNHLILLSIFKNLLFCVYKPQKRSKNGVMYKRNLKFINHSFFLFGPRGVGKSTWLKEVIKDYKSDVLYIDLLLTSKYLEYLNDPSKLVSVVRAKPKDTLIIIDEVQRIPELLNEVHYLMENDGYKNFILTGSSARKLKRNSANLLAGRAIVKKMFTLNSNETEYSISIDEQIKYGMLPIAVSLEDKNLKEEFLKTYVGTYLNEEIKAEGIVRNLGAFSRFLEIVALNAGTQINMSSIARDAEIKRDALRGYFQILEDTLLGTWLPSYKTRLKTKETTKPKFYLFDSGVLNALAHGFTQPLSKDFDGILFEHVIFNELSSYIYYNNIKGELGFWNNDGKSEIDFVWWYGDKIIGIEVKLSKKFKKEFLKGFKSFPKNLHSKYIVYTGDEELLIDDVRVLPFEIFVKRLYNDKIILT